MKKRTFALLLCIVSLCSLLLSACGSSDPLVGSWQANIDLSGQIRESLGENSQFEIDEFILPLVYTFNADGTYALSIDEEEYGKSIEKIRQSFSDSLYKLTESLISTLGVEMTVEDYYSLSETSLEDTVDEMCAGFESLPAEYTQKGTYTAADGKLSLTPEGGSADATIFETYELNGNTLTILGSSAEDAAQSAFYPLTFTRK